jgi:hypothetical protein
MRIVYMIGEPGSGKSTLMDFVFGPHRSSLIAKPFAHMTLGPTDNPWGIELGKIREDFGGTDALSMGVLPIVVKWMATNETPLIVGEGDRLTAQSFFQAAKTHRELSVVHLATPSEEAARRRSKRGSKQNETWIRGRITKVNNLAERYGTHRIDGNLPIREKADLFRSICGLPPQP